MRCNKCLGEPWGLEQSSRVQWDRVDCGVSHHTFHTFLPTTAPLYTHTLPLPHTAHTNHPAALTTQRLTSASVSQMFSGFRSLLCMMRAQRAPNS